MTDIQKAEDERVEAEDERVEAEVKRASVRLFYVKLAGVVALPMAFIALLPALVGIYLVRSESQARSTENRALIEKIEGVAFSTNSALCAFKVDLQNRAENTRRFIAEHPDGIPGISRAEFDRQFANLVATLGSLNALRC